MSNQLGLDFLLESYVDNEIIPKSEAVRDRFGSLWLHRQDLGLPTHIRFGRIVDYVPYANVYKVQADQQHTVWCVSLAQTSLQPFGAKQLNTFAVGAGIFFFWYPSSHLGYIIGVAPDFITDARKGRSDYISQGSRAGLLADACHKNILGMQFQGGVGNYSAGRPVDSTGVGEWGAITETGASIFLDPYLAFLRVDEETGIWATYYDQLLRVAGHNLQIRSALREQEDIDDQDEASMILGISPYPWERMGAFTHGANVYTENDALVTQVSNPELAGIEPKHQDQQAFMRKMEFEGYLGQGGKRLVALPPYPLPAIDTLNRYSDETAFPGVFEENIALNGSYMLTSAKRVVIAKRPLITVPKQVIKPEDKRGDNETNYKASGLLGSGSDHKITGDIDLDGAEEVTTPAAVKTACIFDLIAWMSNWEAQHQFFYHERDWYLPDEDDSYPITSNQNLPTYDVLGTTQYLSYPPASSLRVDHRYGNETYYANESVIALHDDGNITIVDGYGVEYRTCGGTVDVFAPGDINFHAGRNINLDAGRDVTVKARKNIDLTTTCQDIRIKAENGVYVLGGNNGCGGILLESRAICPAYDFCENIGSDVKHSGIFLKATKSRIVAQGGDVVLNANTDTENYVGRIIFDANGSRIQAHAEMYERFLTSASFDFFTDGSGVILGANEYWSDQTIIGSPTSIDGRLDTKGLLSKGWIQIVDGHISSNLSEAMNSLVSVMTPDTATSANEVFTAIDNRVDEIKDLGEEELDKVAYDEMQATHGTVHFSLRTVDQYGTSGYIFVEGKWQQLARAGETANAKWVENPVLTDCTEVFTYPYPGKEIWIGSADDPEPEVEPTITTRAFRLINSKYRDIDTGRAIPREANQEDYEEPEYNATTGVILDGEYPVSVP